MREAAIAIVDDDDDVRDALCSVIRQQGMTTKEFESAEDLLRRLYRDHVGLRIANSPQFKSDGRDADTVLFGAVIDIGLPGINGAQLARHLRSLSPSLPILVVTAFAGGELDQYVTGMEGVSLVQKPFELHDLLDAFIKSQDIGLVSHDI